METQIPASYRMTWQDWVRESPEQGLCELIGGELHVSPAPTPEHIVEVLSPGTARRDLVWKRDLYFRAGVPEYWIVDPAGRHVTVLTRSRAKWKSERAVDVLFSAGLAGFEFPLKALFR